MPTTTAARRLNAIRAQLGALDWSSAPVFTINGLKREELIAANSAFLHELHFDALGGDGVLPRKRRSHEVGDARAPEDRPHRLSVADTARLALTPQSAGLYAISLGLSKTFGDDHEMLRHGLVMYDALYAWCVSCQSETHQWPPAG